MPIPHPPCGLAAPAPRHYTFKFAAKMVSLIPEARASAQAPNIEAAWPKMSHIMFRGFRGLDSCFMTFHLTTVQVQGLAVDVFCTSWETVWGLKILTYYGFHASIAYCKFFFLIISFTNMSPLKGSWWMSHHSLWQHAMVWWIQSLGRRSWLTECY